MLSATMEDLVRTISSAIDENAAKIHDLGQEIWRNPELGNEEFHAHKLICQFFRDNGFTVDDQFLGPTGFSASYGKGPATEAGTGGVEASNGSGAGGHTSSGVHVCLLAEYDALPEIGHASAHNLVTEACLAAALGLKAAIDLNTDIGRVTVLGTPDSEDSGKKVEAIHGGFFKDVDLAATFIPYTANIARPIMLTIMRLTIQFKGKAAHASACPWDGRNALDAAVLCYNNLSVIRQQLKPLMQIHGVITKGGVRPNIIPQHTEMKIWLRAHDHVDMAFLQQKADAAFSAAAKATGCELEFEYTPTPYSNLCPNNLLVSLYKAQAQSHGMIFDTTHLTSSVVGSSDTGNVSHMVPTIAPAFDIGTAAIATNTEGFTEVAGSVEAHEKTMIAAKAMCGTLVQAMSNPETMTSIQNAFEDSRSASSTYTEWH